MHVSVVKSVRRWPRTIKAQGPGAFMGLGGSGSQSRLLYVHMFMSKYVVRVFFCAETQFYHTTGCGVLICCV